MTWDPYNIAGLAQINQTLFTTRTNLIALSGKGAPADGAVDGRFAYDDTAWGQVPDGIYKTLATCAVNDEPPVPHRPSGRYVQLNLSFVEDLGRDYTAFDPSSAPGAGGRIIAFHASMRGFGALVGANESDGSDLASGLPADYATIENPYLFMLRPTALTWPGQDDNLAVRTIWRQSEIDVFNFDFTVNSTSAKLETAFYATGWR